jgi:hypothetical protein
MRSLAAGILMSLLGIACLTECVLAADSYSFPVSCSIPAIPGVNVPPFDNAKGKEMKLDPSTVQEDTEIKNEQGQTILVQTVYGK